MDSKMRELINGLTQDIINLYDIQIPIKDIDEVVTILGGRIEESDNINNMSDGCISKSDDGFVIRVSPLQGIGRRKFTIAHELGHLFLHMGYKINPVLWEQQENLVYYRAGNSIDEYQANEFAAALLMPRQMYKTVMDRYTTGNIVETGKVAEFFGVSVSAASNRGKFLGYLQW